MPRRQRLCAVGIPQHIVQRGVNRQACFADDSDIAAYAHWLCEGASKYGVQVHAWVFMTNHVHLLVTPLQEAASSKMMQYIGRLYVRHFNYRYERTGTLWEGRFHSCIIQQDQYFLACQRYIELNPVRAGIVEDPASYKWSSYQANALGIESKLRSPHPLYLGLGNSKLKRLERYRELFEGEIDGPILFDIRMALNTGLVLGTGKFKKEVEELTGHRTSLVRRGRPAQKKD